MQLLLDVSDLHQYHQRCEAWCRSRTEAIVSNARADKLTGVVIRTTIEKVLKDFDAANPFPSLAPAAVLPPPPVAPPFVIRGPVVPPR